jgi:hypothetical protein
MKKKTKTIRRRRTPRQWPDVDWLEAVSDYCRHLSLLAELLKTCRQSPQSEVVRGIGQAIKRQMKALRALENKLR